MVQEVPEMGRTELVHPLFVHFPIALLILGTLILLCHRSGLFRSVDGQLSFTSRLLLITGSLLSWVTVYTGILADSVVGREVCDPTVLEDHERYGYYVGILFSVVSLFEIGTYYFKTFRWKRSLGKVSLIIALGGVSLLSYEAHLGGKLVYQQAAGVHQPSKDCKEFE